VEVEVPTVKSIQRGGYRRFHSTATPRPHHRSLLTAAPAAAIDWSYVLLSETQQRVFGRLSVFAKWLESRSSRGGLFG